MKINSSLLVGFIRQDKGLEVAEYGLVAALITVISILALTLLGRGIVTTLSKLKAATQ